MRLWGGGNSGGGERALTYEDMQRAVQAGVAPLMQRVEQLSSKVDTLNADHVTRADIDGIRRDMQVGFAGLDTQYVRRELAEQRYTELTEKVSTNEGRIDDIEKKIDSQGVNNLTRIGIAASIIFGFLALLISIMVNVLPHYSYHP